MYFILEGKVNALSANESSVIATLGKGNYFGEIALFMPNARRICSVVAVNFCQLFILRKSDMQSISERFPNLEQEFKKEGIRRLKEFRKKQLDEAGNEEEKEAYGEVDRKLLENENDDILVTNKSIESLIMESEAYKIGPRANIALDNKKLKEILESEELPSPREIEQIEEEDKNTEKSGIERREKEQSLNSKMPRKGREITYFGNQKKLRKFPLTFYKENDAIG